jgi:molybdopterin-guanine dinucleotide biosynthesis protein A
MLPTQISVYILAGGASSRFGSDKARAKVEGKPLILRIVEQLGASILSRSPIVAVAARAGTYEDLGVRTIPDLRPGLGPLGGLHATLYDAQTDWVLLVSCDLVILKPQWIACLVSADRHDGSHRAIAFRHRMWEPMPALYAKSVLPLVESHLDTGKFAMQQLLDAAPALALPLPLDWPATAHVNTVEELERAIRRLGASE